MYEKYIIIIPYNKHHMKSNNVYHTKTKILIISNLVGGFIPSEKY